MHRNVKIAALAVILLAGCRKPHEPEGYRVVGYDGRTHQWTIIRTGTFDGKFLKKRMVVQCESYTWGRHPSVKGDDACHLEVGRLIVSNPFPKNSSEQFVEVFEIPDEVLSITEGEGDDRVMQQFTILKYDLIQDR